MARRVLYITERCVFELTKDGLALVEVAPGIDIEKDILAHMDFKPIINNPKTMDARIFQDGPMGLKNKASRHKGDLTMKPMRLHHVGIVLPTLEKAHQFMQNNGLEIDYAGYVDAYQADLIFTKFGDYASPIEMIIPHSGVLTKFNGGRGGIAHIAFEVDDVEKVRQIMEGQQPGCMLEKKAVQGTDDIVVNFRRPSTDAGILVEYVQTVAPINRSNPNPFQN